jgi:hypothetical protein
MSNYSIFVFKQQNTANLNGMKLHWNGQSTVAPSSSQIVLQAYNRNITTWVTFASNNVANADTDINLDGTITPAQLPDYEDGSGWVACRVYQETA